MSFKILLHVNNTAGHPTALIKTYNEVNDVFTPASTTSIPQVRDQEVNSAFNSYYLRSTFCKAIVVIYCDSSEGSGQSKLKTF